MNFQQITHPDDLEPDLVLSRRLLSGEFPSYQMEKRYIHKDGHTVWIHLSTHSCATPTARPRTRLPRCSTSQTGSRRS